MSHPSSDSEVAFESSESISSKTQQKHAIPARTFRKTRGENIRKLLEKENLAEEADEFWQTNEYFGKIGEIEDSDEEYEKESSVKDQFDSDFASDSEENADFLEDPARFPEENDEKVRKNPKKLLDFSQTFAKKAYIHEFFTQEELLKEAAVTEILNKKSLEDLVRLEEEKKKRNTGNRGETDSPKVKFVDTCRDGARRSFLCFSNEDALRNELKCLKNGEFEEKRGNFERKEGKYRDPVTKERFNCVEEYASLEKKIKKVKKKGVKAMLKAQTALLERKKQAFSALK